MTDIVEGLRDRTFPIDYRDRCKAADEIEKLRAENTGMKELLREVLHQILYPLAHEERALGKIAEGFGQAMRAAIDKVTR